MSNTTTNSPAQGQYDTRSADEIERDIEEERSALSSTLAALQDRFSLDGVVGNFAEGVKSQSGEIGKSFAQAVKDNPAAFALTGLGVAWLVYGSSQKKDPSDAPARTGATTLQPPATRRPAEFTDRLDAAEASHDDAGSAWGSVKSRASDLMERVADGTEHMTEEARKRVIRARVKAVELQRKTEEKLRDHGGSAADLYQRQPLVGGLIALAAGAAVAALLPRTDQEDRAFGDRSDALFDEARRIFEEERSKLTAVAHAAAKEARDVAREAHKGAEERIPDGRSAAKTVTDAVKTAGERVADAAKDEAQKQNLGKI